jgi:hypothetical protein
MSPTITQHQIEMLLAVVRLGDADRLGWWRSHSVDETAEYVLAHGLPATWMATGVELAMESARIRHHMELARPTAVHLFSDYLPFHRELRAWLIARKLGRDFDSLVWLSEPSVNELRARLGASTTGERRGKGIYLGDLPRESLNDGSALEELLARLASAYAGRDEEFVAPYVDLV